MRSRKILLRFTVAIVLLTLGIVILALFLSQDANWLSRRATLLDKPDRLPKSLTKVDPSPSSTLNQAERICYHGRQNKEEILPDLVLVLNRERVEDTSLVNTVEVAGNVVTYSSCWLIHPTPGDYLAELYSKEDSTTPVYEWAFRLTKE